MSYEKQKPQSGSNMYRNLAKILAQKEVDPIDMKMQVLQNSANQGGFGAIFDPGKAVRQEYQNVIDDAEDAINPQHQGSYVALEGGPNDFFETLEPGHDVREALGAFATSQASIETNEDGTHTLKWEGLTDAVVNDSGQLVGEQPQPLPPSEG